jgi:hypothetical protein
MEKADKIKKKLNCFPKLEIMDSLLYKIFIAFCAEVIE